MGPLRSQDRKTGSLAHKAYISALLSFFSGCFLFDTRSHHVVMTSLELTMQTWPQTYRYPPPWVLSAGVKAMHHDPMGSTHWATPSPPLCFRHGLSVEPTLAQPCCSVFAFNPPRSLRESRINLTKS